ncbi:hypothetical protein CSW28_08900 [Thermus scotoductus]|nr:hypothetical protein CSW28_08900 [Thermus scotoductus]
MREVDCLCAGDDDSPLGALSRGLKGSVGLGNVRFWGRREDMPELYRAADAVLLPTLGENQSLATLEAMASRVARLWFSPKVGRSTASAAR